jgi:hypothetical protein
MGIPFEARSSYVTHPGAYETTIITCMDDRPGELGLQIGGGVYGLSQDRAAAMEMVSPGSFNGLDMDLHIFAGAVTEALARKNMDGLMHHGCAAFELADTTVAETLSRDDKLDELFGIAKDIYLPIGFADENRGWGMFMRGVQAQRKIIESGKLPTREQAEHDLFSHEEPEGSERGLHSLYMRPRRIHLDEPKHKAGDAIINHVPGYAFDNRKAWDAGHPAYHVSVGGFAEMNWPLDEHFGSMPVGAFTLASAARHAAIISVLPKPEGQDALNVHSIRHL